MKKRLTMIVLVLVCALALSACGCKHEVWNEANCEPPKTCAECGEIEGAPLGHSWIAATCETAKTCEVCGKTDGEIPGHAWVEADCENPKTCSTCGLTEGEALGHIWIEATTETPKTCSVCAATEGERIITDPRFTTAATAEVQGKWGYMVEVTGEMIGEAGFEGTIKYFLVLELKNDGTMAMYMQMADASEMYAYLKDALYTALAAQGMDKEAADAAVKQAYNMTMDQYAEYIFSLIDMDAILAAFNIDGVYYVEDGKIYSGVSWDSQLGGDAYILEGDTLTLLVDVIGSGEENTVFVRMVDEE